MPLLLLLEGDAELRLGLERHFAAEGYAVEGRGRSDDALDLLGAASRGLAQRPDAALLGLARLGDNLEVLAAIRRDEVLRGLPVVQVTASSDEIDQALGREHAADDYLQRPFGLREASARVRALLRRAVFMEAHPRGQVLRQGGIEIDLDLHQASRAGDPLDLTRREFELLAYFLQNPGRVLPRERILHEVWGLEYLGESRTIDAHVRRLRGKLGPDAARIETLVGVGYRFAAREPGNGESFSLPRS